jgi:hypothetical protein
VNRHDEIQAVARDIASNVHADPEARNRMADDLIKLVGLMLGGLGKYLATEGESQMNDVADWDEPGEDATPEGVAEFQRERELDGSKFHGMYLTGEQIQDSARELVEKCQGADLERYRRDPVWVHEDRRPAMFRHTDARGALIIPPELIEATAGGCCHEGPVEALPTGAGQDRMSTRCCYPLGGVCPEHC